MLLCGECDEENLPRQGNRQHAHASQCVSSVLASAGNELSILSEGECHDALLSNRRASVRRGNRDSLYSDKVLGVTLRAYEAHCKGQFDIFPFFGIFMHANCAENYFHLDELVFFKSFEHFYAHAQFWLPLLDKTPLLGNARNQLGASRRRQSTVTPQRLRPFPEGFLSFFPLPCFRGKRNVSPSSLWIQYRYKRDTQA